MTNPHQKHTREEKAIEIDTPSSHDHHTEKTSAADIGTDVLEKEFGNIKKKAIGKSKQLANWGKDAFDWVKENRDILVGIPLLAYGMYLLRNFVVGILFLIGGLLFILGYAKKWIETGETEEESDA